MKKKGFTLIELLAVIVILAIIAIITIPMIMNVIDKAKLGALEDSAYGLVESANLYYSENISDIKDKVIFDFKDGKQTSDTILKYKGNIEEGKLILNTDGKVVVCIDDKTNYAYKELNEKKVITGKGTCSYNGETGDFTITSDIDTLNKQVATLQNELNDLTSKINKATATPDQILEGYSAVTNDGLVEGNLKSKIIAAGIGNNCADSFNVVPTADNNYVELNNYVMKIKKSGDYVINYGLFGSLSNSVYPTADLYINNTKIQTITTNVSGGHYPVSINYNFTASENDTVYLVGHAKSGVTCAILSYYVYYK